MKNAKIVLGFVAVMVGQGMFFGVLAAIIGALITFLPYGIFLPDFLYLQLYVIPFGLMIGGIIGGLSGLFSGILTISTERFIHNDVSYVYMMVLLNALWASVMAFWLVGSIFAVMSVVDRSIMNPFGILAGVLAAASAGWCGWSSAKLHIFNRQTEQMDTQRL